jgi:hypothetical protein
MQQHNGRATSRAGIGVADAQRARVDLLQRAERGAHVRIAFLLAVGAVFIVVYRCEPATALAAVTMTSVTAWGWEIMITCEPSTSVMSAPAR